MPAACPANPYSVSYPMRLLGIQLFLTLTTFTIQDFLVTHPIIKIVSLEDGDVSATVAGVDISDDGLGVAQTEPRGSGCHGCCG